MQVIDDQIHTLHASACQTLAPTRLKILNALRGREIAVAELARRVGTNLPNLSQHLAILRHRRVVLTRREGVTIYYRTSRTPRSSGRSTSCARCCSSSSPRAGAS
jgi:DNA-binding transcriptional ArsR family regulator